MLLGEESQPKSSSSQETLQLSFETNSITKRVELLSSLDAINLNEASLGANEEDG